MEEALGSGLWAESHPVLHLLLGSALPLRRTIGGGEEWRAESGAAECAETLVPGPGQSALAKLLQRSFNPLQRRVSVICE